MKTVREFFTGVGFVFRGFRFWAQHPGLAAIGAIPPLIVGAVIMTLMILLIANVGTFVAWATPFADGWDALWRDLMRFTAAALLAVGTGVLFVLTFSAVSLAVGTPVYDRISKAVDEELGAPEQRRQLGFWASVGKSLTDALILVLVAVLVALLVFAVGLIPGIGSFFGFLLGVILGGRALAVDMTGTPMDARGLTLGERRARLRTNWPRTMGFGIACYLLFMIPLVAVFAMPAATAGATLLTRSLFDERLDRAG